MLTCPVCGEVCVVEYKLLNEKPAREICCSKCCFSSYYFNKFEETVANYYRFKYIIENKPSEIIETYVRDKRTQDYIRALLKDESN